MLPFAGLWGCGKVHRPATAAAHAPQLQTIRANGTAKNHSRIRGSVSRYEKTAYQKLKKVTGKTSFADTAGSLAA